MPRRLHVTSYVNQGAPARAHPEAVLKSEAHPLAFACFRGFTALASLTISR
ncbi:MAG: hypothetical protein ACP5E5_15060 [Acidobacteriaceae bacterium]